MLRRGQAQGRSHARRGGADARPLAGRRRQEGAPGALRASSLPNPGGAPTRTDPHHRHIGLAGSEGPPGVTGGPRRPQRAPGVTGGPRRPQRAPGVTGGPRRPQRAPGSNRRPQEAPESPGSNRRPQEALWGPGSNRRPQKPPAHSGLLRALPGATEDSATAPTCCARFRSHNADSKRPPPDFFTMLREGTSPGGRSHARRGGADARPLAGRRRQEGAPGALRASSLPNPGAHPPAQTRTTAISV